MLWRCTNCHLRTNPRNLSCRTNVAAITLTLLLALTRSRVLLVLDKRGTILEDLCLVQTNNPEVQDGHSFVFQSVAKHKLFC